jgi:hypothetical protein
MSGQAHDPPDKRRDVKDLYLEQLDKQSQSGPGSERRRHERHSLRAREGLEVMFDAFDGQPMSCRVRPRNLSQSGIAFLHEAYVYPETRCTVVLITLTDQPIEISGKVVGCRHVTGKLHEVAVQFDRVIDPDDFHDCIQDAMRSSEV